MGRRFLVKAEWKTTPEKIQLDQEELHDFCETKEDQMDQVKENLDGCGGLRPLHSPKRHSGITKSEKMTPPKVNSDQELINSFEAMEEKMDEDENFENGICPSQAFIQDSIRPKPPPLRSAQQLANRSLPQIDTEQNIQQHFEQKNSFPSSSSLRGIPYEQHSNFTSMWAPKNNRDHYGYTSFPVGQSSSSWMGGQPSPLPLVHMDMRRTTGILSEMPPTSEMPLTSRPYYQDFHHGIQNIPSGPTSGGVFTPSAAGIGILNGNFSRMSFQPSFQPPRPPASHTSRDREEPMDLIVRPNGNNQRGDNNMTGNNTACYPLPIYGHSEGNNNNQFSRNRKSSKVAKCSLNFNSSGKNQNCSESTYGSVATIIAGGSIEMPNNFNGGTQDEKRIRRTLTVIMGKFQGEISMKWIEPGDPLPQKDKKDENDSLEDSNLAESSGSVSMCGNASSATYGSALNLTKNENHIPSGQVPMPSHETNGQLNESGDDEDEELPEAPEQPSPLICQVCKTKATGHHYGIITCEGCKGFFKRTVQSRNVYTCKTGTCGFTEDGKINCRYCRFRSCLQAKMVLQAIREDKTPGGRQPGIITCLYKNPVNYKKQKKCEDESANENKIKNIIHSKSKSNTGSKKKSSRNSKIPILNAMSKGSKRQLNLIRENDEKNPSVNITGSMLPPPPLGSILMSALTAGPSEALNRRKISDDFLCNMNSGFKSDDSHDIAPSRENQSQSNRMTLMTSTYHSIQNILKLNNASINESVIVSPIRRVELYSEQTALVKFPDLSQNKPVAFCNVLFVSPHDPVLLNNGQLVTLDGRIVSPTGQVLSHNGRVLSPEELFGSSNERERTVFYFYKGKFVSNDGRVVSPDGRVVSPDEQVVPFHQPHQEIRHPEQINDVNESCY